MVHRPQRQDCVFQPSVNSQALIRIFSASRTLLPPRRFYLLFLLIQFSGFPSATSGFLRDLCGKGFDIAFAFLRVSVSPRLRGECLGLGLGFDFAFGFALKLQITNQKLQIFSSSSWWMLYRSIIM